MLIRVLNFLSGRSGSVTTDWVVLVASLILISVLVMTTVTGGAVDVSDEVSATLSSMDAG